MRSNCTNFVNVIPESTVNSSNLKCLRIFACSWVVTENLIRNTLNRKLPNDTNDWLPIWYFLGKAPKVQDSVLNSINYWWAIIPKQIKLKSTCMPNSGFWSFLKKKKKNLSLGSIRGKSERFYLPPSQFTLRRLAPFASPKLPSL